MKLEEYIDPVIKFAMRDLHGMIFAYRQTAITNKALTMEVHLAQLPTVFARMFRNVFFPLWDMVLERTIEAVRASSRPRAEVGKQLSRHARSAKRCAARSCKAWPRRHAAAALPDAGFNFKDRRAVKKLRALETIVKTRASVEGCGGRRHARSAGLEATHWSRRSAHEAHRRSRGRRRHRRASEEGRTRAEGKRKKRRSRRERPVPTRKSRVRHRTAKAAVIAERVTTLKPSRTRLAGAPITTLGDYPISKTGNPMTHKPRRNRVATRRIRAATRSDGVAPSDSTLQSPVEPGV